MKDITLVVDDKHYVMAFVAYDAEKNWTVASFRATVCGHNGKDYFIDLDALQVKYNENSCYGKGCKMHQGFKESI